MGHYYYHVKYHIQKWNTVRLAGIAFHQLPSTDTKASLQWPGLEKGFKFSCRKPARILQEVCLCRSDLPRTNKKYKGKIHFLELETLKVASWKKKTIIKPMSRRKHGMNRAET